ncbi:hypothetical protein SEA_STEAMY_18 [Mycobacterium phage Steamy]|uniref:Head-to-tail connector protein n=1 Tax=Mycobacterium phage Steamy TaxID=2250309 RepID=A0A345L0J1_9CAUD|nr:hypothetical protein KIV62_gp83 [Mycobacterium phage Steamy]AXH48793.1 hypothetical protein SEA_STEAMY_18 [Mycobacterium phage Steamy]
MPVGMKAGFGKSRPLGGVNHTREDHMKIRSTLNGGVAEVDDDYAERLIEAGGWEVAEALAPTKTKRIRRTKEQIAADKAAEAAKNQE